MADAGRCLTAEVMERIALVTVNVPKFNVATPAILDAFTDVLARYAEDPAVRAMVITGSGHHAFMTDPEPSDAAGQSAYDAAADRASAALAAFPKPSIARVRGNCFGAGLMLALQSDVIIAAEDSDFALPGARRGAAYAPLTTTALARLVGPQHARRMLYTGRRIHADEALRIGLITLLVPDSDLSDVVVDMADEMASNAPLAVRASKRIVANPDDPALATIADECRGSQDYALGIAAMHTEKRPAFTGR